MPPACPVDCYVPCYTNSVAAGPECHRLARWIVTFLATQTASPLDPNATGLPGGLLRSLLHKQRRRWTRMPPARPVDCYVPCYTNSVASGPECHRLARWIVTFLATQTASPLDPNATGLPGGLLRSLLHKQRRLWTRMPPACPVDCYVPCYRKLRTQVSTGQAGGINCSPACRHVARSVTIPRADNGTVSKRCRGSFGRRAVRPARRHSDRRCCIWPKTKKQRLTPR